MIARHKALSHGRRLALMAWISVLLLMVVALQRAGHGQLTPPPLNARALAWLETRPPAVAAFALLRWVALILAVYLLAASVASVATRITRCRRLIRWSDMVTPCLLRRFVGAAVGLTLTAAPLVGPSPAMAAPHALLATSPVTSTTPDPAPTLALLAPASTSAPMLSTWLVRPGDNFWSIATNVLADEERSVATSEVATYWRLLIEANVGRLRIRSDPSLIYAGQRLDVPPPPT